MINPTPVASKNLNHASRSGSWIFAHVEDLSSLKVNISVLQVGISTYLKSKEGPTESPTVCGSVPQSLAQFGCIDKIEKMDRCMTFIEHLSQKVLARIDRNDPRLTRLRIGVPSSECRSVRGHKEYQFMSYDRTIPCLQSLVKPLERTII